MYIQLPMSIATDRHIADALNSIKETYTSSAAPWKAETGVRLVRRDNKPCTTKDVAAFIFAVAKVAAPDDPTEATAPILDALMSGTIKLVLA